MKIAYLIGQYPAINHGYLLREIAFLREAGIDVSTISISPPDRAVEKLSTDERAEASRTFYVKSQSLIAIAMANLRTFVRRPLRYLKGMRRAIAAGNWRWLAYFAEAVVVGDWMSREGLRDVHVSFSLNVTLLLLDVFDVRASLAIYGFGELTPPGSASLVKLAPRLRFIRCISWHSRSMAMLLSIPELWDRIKAAPLGVEPSLFAPVPFREAPAPFTLTSVGRLAPEKAQIMLINAVARLRYKGCDVRLRLVGDGPQRAALEKRAAACRIGDRVVFEGYVDQDRLMNCYRETDAFVMTSLYEGIPIVLMEAMAMEIPCVAPRITGIPELIEDNLERALQQLMDNISLRRELAVNGRKRILAAYDLRRNTEQFAKLLRD
jgi:colanic acid/amylovoran biosynthesis glycosyltransferase